MEIPDDGDSANRGIVHSTFRCEGSNDDSLRDPHCPIRPTPRGLQFGLFRYSLGDRKLHRLMCYIAAKKHHRQIRWVGD